jgi:hypothetical protein
MTDILLNNENDLNIINGDFDLGDSTYQNQKLLILASKGEFKETPTSCVGSKKYLEEGNADSLAREIRQEFIADGMTVNEIIIKENNAIEVEANYL